MDINVLLVDDERLIRQALAVLLGSQEDITVVGEAGDGVQALDFCQNNDVDLVLMDIRMPGINGIEACRLIKNYDENIKILMLTTFEDTDYISQAMNYGASGYLLKNQDHTQIYEGIKAAMSGNIVLDSKVGKHLLTPKQTQEDNNDFDYEAYDLTEKKLEIIILIAQGLSNQEIADELHLSVGTVKNNITDILSKLDLRDRTQLAIFAFKNNLL